MEMEIISARKTSHSCKDDKKKVKHLIFPDLADMERRITLSI